MAVDFGQFKKPMLGSISEIISDVDEDDDDHDADDDDEDGARRFRE